MVRVNINIPDDLHRRVKSHASLDGKTVRDYVIESLKTKIGDTDADL